jgi:hypothetical protein
MIKLTPPPLPDEQFKEPILTLLFRIGGSVFAAFAVMGIVGAIAGGSSSFLAALIVTASMLVTSAIFFGAAQVVRAVAETAFNTRRAADRVNEANRALQWIVNNWSSRP